jgi:lysophospholipase L1-like esterase
VASALHVATFRDVTCSGATTGDILGRQRVELIWNVAPQIDAVTEDTSLVTISIGGNDIGFADIAATCGLLSLLDASGDPCHRSYTSGGIDVLAAAVAAAGPKVAAVLASIRGHAPTARVVVVGYPELLPAEGPGCWPIMPIAAGDVPYLRGIEEQLNATVAAQARLAGDTFVDTYGPSRDHDACQPPGVKWVEGLLPQSPSIPIHPNALGMQGMAGAIVGTLGAG